MQWDCFVFHNMMQVPQESLEVHKYEYKSGYQSAHKKESKNNQVTKIKLEEIVLSLSAVK